MMMGPLGGQRLKDHCSPLLRAPAEEVASTLRGTNSIDYVIRLPVVRLRRDHPAWSVQFFKRMPDSLRLPPRALLRCYAIPWAGSIIFPFHMLHSTPFAVVDRGKKIQGLASQTCLLQALQHHSDPHLERRP